MAAVSGGQSISGSDTGASAPPLLVDYTHSRLLLPAGVASTAIDTRLRSVRQRVPSFASPSAEEDVSSGAGQIAIAWGETAGPGSFVLSERSGSVLLVVRRDDATGIEAGISRLVRELHVEHSSGTARLPRQAVWVHNASAALWPMRGHQVSTAHYPSSLKTWADFRTFVSDLAVFGTNQIEVAHIVSLCDDAEAAAGTNCLLPEAALVNFSRAVDDAHLNVSMWFPLSLCSMSNAEEVFAKMPRLTSLLHEGGWGTQTNWDAAAACAQKLRRHHPAATVWAAAAAHNDSLLTAFFEAFEAHRELDFVSGLATHMAPTTFPDYVARAPRRLASKIRQYPDICHTVHAQFPMPQWHYVWALVHVRNPVTVLPRHMAAIVRQGSNGSSPNVGFGGYSEGLSDDVNKVVWSALAESPELSVEEIIRQYSRYHFGAEHEEAMTTAIFGLEENWKGDIRSNDAVRQTLGAIQSVEGAMTEPELHSNWRLLALLFRAYFDAHVQARFRFEMQQQENAYQALGRAAVAGSAIAFAAARAALNTTNPDPTVAGWHAKVLQLAAAINGTLGAPVLQSQAVDLNLHTFDTPLNDRTYITATVESLAKLPTEAARLGAISDMLYWDVPKEGGYFDRLGSSGVLAGRAPRLDVGEGESDPAFYFTPHHETLAQTDWHCPQAPSSSLPLSQPESGRSACDAVGVVARMDWTSFTLGPSRGDHPVVLNYQDLDPAANYSLSVLFFSSEFKTFLAERNTLTAGSTVLQSDALSVRPMRRVTFAVPKHETKGGSLRVACTSPRTNNGLDSFETGGCSIVAVWLEPKPAATPGSGHSPRESVRPLPSLAGGATPGTV